MRKIYYLSTCTTCKRIISEVNPSEDFVLQDIKSEELTEDQLDEMAELSGNYESLFSRIARKYKELGLKEKTLTEQDYRTYILEEYTFLKRPVFIIDGEIFIGNSKKNVEAVKTKLSSL